MIRKTIPLTDTRSDWVEPRITSGDFTNGGEYFRDSVRRDRERNAWMYQLRAALLEGEQSGLSGRTPQEIRAAVTERVIKGRGG